MTCDDGNDCDDDSSEDWDSGPFCKHWGDPTDCDYMCKCGHKCCEHWGDPCDVEGCACDNYCDDEDTDATS